MGKRAGHGAPPPRLSARSDPPSTRRRARAKTARAARPDGRRGRRQLVGVLRDEAGVDLAALEAGQVQDHGVVDRRRGDAEDDQLRAAARASAPGAPAPRAVLAHSAVRLAGWHLCNLDGGRPLATYIAYYTCIVTFIAARAWQPRTPGRAWPPAWRAPCKPALLPPLAHPLAHDPCPWQAPH